ncbi:MAG: hypothetical protein EAZ74_00240 [Alphaproteobacteria bacterium]|nr:MAG: hypothetical protein EAY76_05285 [Alphaproteobacteria bacterium]TAF16090.1 MAG: hypothetical protein EAZ74_00240 [Alphaproteobacteria bacterium]TAF75902.1 MAG: hypothetical protein EAZ52_05395 [Alphaproteobacteria bacterium]
MNTILPPHTSPIPSRSKASRPRSGARHASYEEVVDVMPPVGRGFTVIPNPEVLSSLIERALLALREGKLWDRGSILNIEV